jgi:hypothetical protein
MRVFNFETEVIRIASLCGMSNFDVDIGIYLPDRRDAIKLGGLSYDNGEPILDENKQIRYLYLDIVDESKHVIVRKEDNRNLRLVPYLHISPAMLIVDALNLAQYFRHDHKELIMFNPLTNEDTQLIPVIPTTETLNDALISSIHSYYNIDDETLAIVHYILACIIDTVHFDSSIVYNVDYGGSMLEVVPLGSAKELRFDESLIKIRDENNRLKEKENDSLWYITH